MLRMIPVFALILSACQSDESLVTTTERSPTVILDNCPATLCMPIRDSVAVTWQLKSRRIGPLVQAAPLPAVSSPARPLVSVAQSPTAQHIALAVALRPLSRPELHDLGLL